jgi:hypothetical protein
MSSNNIENQLTPESAERMMQLELQTKEIELELQNSIRQRKQIELELQNSKTKQIELETKQIELETKQIELKQFNSKSNETIEYR